MDDMRKVHCCSIEALYTLNSPPAICFNKGCAHNIISSRRTPKSAPSSDPEEPQTPLTAKPSKLYALNPKTPNPCWVLVRGFNLSYHKKETILFTIDPYYGNLN